MKKTIHCINQILTTGKPLALATVIDQKGSGPRHPGAHMIITADGQAEGTIGGGILEADVIRAAGRVIEEKRSVIRHIDMTYDHLVTGNMICGGTMAVLIAYVAADPDGLDCFRTLEACYRDRRKAALVTVITHGDGEQVHTRHQLWLDGMPPTGVADLPPGLDRARLEKALHNGHPQLIDTDTGRFWIDPICFAPVLCLFGAGHVSLPTATLAATVDFQVKVIDDREELMRPERFPESIELLTTATFEGALAELDIDGDSYLVIVTRGHLHDKVVLAQALRTEAAYIGMIGSRKKRDTIYRALLSDGITEDDLKRVHCPIGLEIGAETPEEIAVSIVAELIKTRAERKRE
jgi:xanthine dehydrogenase accessory factor